MFEGEIRLRNGTLLYVWSDYRTDRGELEPLIRRVWLYTDEANDISEEYYPRDEIMAEIESKVVNSIYDMISQPSYKYEV